MYETTVTIFNYHETTTTGEAYWYPHVLLNVDLNTDKGAILKRYGVESSDTAQLHILYGTNKAGKKVILAKDCKEIPWIPPKEWKRQEKELLSETITFSTDSDFFWQGDWQGGIVTDAEYRDGFYQYMNRNEDYVFKITSVGGPYSLIPHFEILAK